MLPQAMGHSMYISFFTVCPSAISLYGVRPLALKENLKHNLPFALVQVELSFTRKPAFSAALLYASSSILNVYEGNLDSKTQNQDFQM
jgi:hypothetical protein